MGFCSTMLDVIEIQIELVGMDLCSAIFGTIVSQDIFHIQILGTIER